MTQVAPYSPPDYGLLDAPEPVETDALGLWSGAAVYIAGPMTGVEDWNFPLFFSVERALKAQGYRPINPAKNDGRTLTSSLRHANSAKRDWAWYMRRDLRHLSRADAICLLPGWHNSRGAVLERHIAAKLGMPVFVWLGGIREMAPQDGVRV